MIGVTQRSRFVTEDEERRLRSVFGVVGTAPVFLPASEYGAYCLLTESEFHWWTGPRAVEVLLRLSDEQGHPIVLVKMP